MRKDFKDLFKLCKNAVIPVIITDKNGDKGIGTAFHVGEGVFVSAKHLFEESKAARLLVPADTYETFIKNDFPNIPSESTLTFPINPKFPSNEYVDVAVFRISELANLPVVELGGHLDDWVNDDDFILEEILIFGYPPIPMTVEPYLVTVKGEINALVNVRHSDHFQFIVSAIPRGGFSGGVAMLPNMALGVVTSSLVKNNQDAETGFMSILTIEPILVCLGEHGLIPTQIRDVFRDLFDPEQK